LTGLNKQEDDFHDEINSFSVSQLYPRISYKQGTPVLYKLRNEKLERNIMTRETLEHGEDPVSDSADKNNGRHIFDLVIKVNKLFSF